MSFSNQEKCHKRNAKSYKTGSNYYFVPIDLGEPEPNGHNDGTSITTDQMIETSIKSDQNCSSVW